MKRIIIAIVLFQSIISFSQEKKLKNGVYSAFKTGKELNILVQNNKLYLFAFEFEYSVSKDSLLDIKINKPNGFYLGYSQNTAVPSGKIRLNISNITNSLNDFYIGTQNQNAPIVYKSFTEIKELQDSTSTVNFDAEGLFLDIEKTKKIILVATNSYEYKAESAAFEIPDNTNNITIYYTSKSDLYNLTGTHNAKKDEVTLLNDGKEPLTFKLSENLEKEDFVKSIETTFQNNLTFLGKKIADGELAATATDTSKQYVEEQKSKFAFYKSKDFKDALKNISKTLDKFLVVSFDLKNKNRQSDFDTYITNLETAINDYGSYGSGNEQFVYYLATEKDKNLLSKYKIKSESELLIFNSSGDLVYHTPENLTTNAKLFGSYDSAYSELSKANLKLLFDKVLLNKKATDLDVTEMLCKVNILDFPKVAEDPVKQDLPVKMDEPTVIEINVPKSENTQDAEIKTITDEERNATEATPPPPPPPPSADSIKLEEAPVASYDDYNDIIKDKKNLYELKCTLKIVNDRWQEILLKKQKVKKIESSIISIIKQQLNNEGFSKKIFDQSSPKSIDFLMLNYVFENYKNLNLKPEIKEVSTAPTITVDDATKAAEQAVDAAASAVSYANEDSQDINTILDNYFYRVAYEDYDEKSINEKKMVFEYFKKYVVLREYNTQVTKKYIDALNVNVTDEFYKKAFFETFELYFNKIMKPNKSIIENLDIEFSNLAASDYADWTTYKNSFAGDCNRAAWEVVKSNNYHNLMQIATKWSETGNELQKNDHYYADTLARLYYLNGQKDKAIISQQKAVDLGKDSENIAEYKMVLEQMKSGTYIYAEPKE